MAKTKSAAIGGISAADEAKWRAESDLRTLATAAEIKKDPARLKRALAMAKEQMAALSTVTSSAAKKD